MEQSIFEIVIYGLVFLFILGFIWMIGNFMIGGFVEPIMKGMDPHNAAGQGIETTQYQTTADHLYIGFKYFFYIAVAGLIFALVMKAWFNSENVSQGYGVYG
jgi:hypothetical protein